MTDGGVRQAPAGGLVGGSCAGRETVKRGAGGVAEIYIEGCLKNSGTSAGLIVSHP